MKYRIKITTFSNGRKAFLPQFKTKLFWLDIDSYGASEIHTPFWDGYDDRDLALRNIDLHYDGNSKKQTIEFEYIAK